MRQALLDQNGKEVDVSKDDDLRQILWALVHLANRNHGRELVNRLALDKSLAVYVTVGIENYYSASANMVNIVIDNVSETGESRPFWIALAHELAHAYIENYYDIEMWRGSWYENISNSEKIACFIENLVRDEFGEDLRDSYGYKYKVNSHNGGIIIVPDGKSDLLLDGKINSFGFSFPSE